MGKLFSRINDSDTLQYEWIKHLFFEVEIVVMVGGFEGGFPGVGVVVGFG